MMSAFLLLACVSGAPACQLWDVGQGESPTVYATQAACDGAVAAAAWDNHIVVGRTPIMFRCSDGGKIHVD